MGVFRVADQARADLVEIWLYIARGSVASAERLNTLFHDKFSVLAQSPMIGRRRPELASEIRSFPVGNYAIFYRVIENRIEIIRVLNQARDIDALF